MKKTKSSSNKLLRVVIIIGLLFFVPLFSAHLFYNHKAWLPKHTLNHGHLVVPPFSMQQLNLDPSDLHQHWGLMYVHTGSCDSLCQRWLYNMIQIQKALGKDTNRLQRLLVSSNKDVIDAQLRKLLADSNTTYKQVDTSGLDKRPNPTEALYIIDPLGNFVLAYPVKTNPEWVLDDLKILMGQVG